MHCILLVASIVHIIISFNLIFFIISFKRNNSCFSFIVKKSLELKVTQLELEIEELKAQVKYIDRDNLVSSAIVQTDLTSSTKMVQTDDVSCVFPQFPKMSIIIVFSPYCLPILKIAACRINF